MTDFGDWSKKRKTTSSISNEKKKQKTINNDKLKRKKKLLIKYKDSDFNYIGNYKSDNMKKKYKNDYNLNSGSSSSNSFSNNSDDDSYDDKNKINEYDYDDPFVEHNDVIVYRDSEDNNTDDDSNSYNDSDNNIINIENNDNEKEIRSDDDDDSWLVITKKLIAKNKINKLLELGQLCNCCRKTLPGYSSLFTHKSFRCNKCIKIFCGECIVDDKPKSERPHYTCLSIDCYEMNDIPLKSCCFKKSKFENINNCEIISVEIINKICENASILSIYSLSLVCRRFRFYVKKYLDMNLENRFKLWIAKWLDTKFTHPVEEKVYLKWYRDILYPLKNNLPVYLSGSSILYFLMDTYTGFNDFDYYYMNIKNIEYTDIAPSKWINSNVSIAPKHYIYTHVTTATSNSYNKLNHVMMDFVAINYPFTSVEKYISTFHFSILRNYLKYNNNSGKLELFIGNIEDIIKGIAHVNTKSYPYNVSTPLSKKKLKRIDTLRSAHINKYFNKKFKFERFNSKLKTNFKFIPIDGY